MAPRSEDFCFFSAYGAALSTLSMGKDGTQKDVKLSVQDANLFNHNGRYSVVHEMAPHLSREMRMRLFIAFREKVSETLQEKFEETGAADYDAESFDPLLIRNWFSMAPMGSKPGLCGVGADFSWTEDQKDFLAQLKDDFNSLIEMEASTNAQRIASGNNAFRAKQDSFSCQPCDPNAIQISSRFDERLDAVERALREEFDVTEDVAAEIESSLKQKQDFLEGPALESFRSEFFDAATESGMKNTDMLAKMFFDGKKAADKENTGQMDPKSMQDRIFKDLVRLNDHFYILLPDLCRRLCDAKEGGLFGEKVQIMERVAPHVSQQYRKEQTDLSLLEHTRRVRFEREKLTTQMVDELLNGNDDNNGLMLAKCPPGCVC